MLSDVEKRMVHMASLLGMTPSDRTRIGLGEVKAQNAFEQMLANRRTGGPQ
jgi:phage terminase small subunit